MKKRFKTLKNLFRGKLALQFAFKPFSISTRLREPTSSEKLVLQMALNKIDLVLDVGANKGQFGSELRNAGYIGRIISFEPLSEAHAQLTQVASKYHDWVVAPRAAVGTASGKTRINISKNLHASSLLPMLKQTRESAPSSVYIGTEEVDVISLDACELIPKGHRILLKSDTQGFEQQVLNGAKKLLKDQIVGLHLEMLLTPLYEGQPDFILLFSNVVDDDFSVWSFETAFRDPETRQLQAIDATFFRKS